MGKLLRIYLRQIIIASIILASCIVFAAKLFIYAPWFGADTYPLYPKTLGDVEAVLLSSWNYYNSRTSVGFGVEYTSAVYYMLGSIAGPHAQPLVAIIWLFVGSLGMYMVARMFKTNTIAALISALSYLATAITWHEVVNSVYGMLGAYALTPWVLIAILYGLKASGIQSYVIGLAAGLVTAPVLTAYYGVFALLIWLPFALSLTLASLKTRQATRVITNLLIFLAGFMAAYLLPMASTMLTNSEYAGVRSAGALVHIKLGDFKFNYSRNINILYWLLYPWFLLVLKHPVLALPLALVAGVIVLSLLQVRSPYAHIPVLGLAFAVGFVALAHLASTTGMIDHVWGLPLVPFLLSALAQPIKVGLVIPLYYSLAIAIATQKNKKLAPLLASLAIVTLCTYAYWLPIGSQNNVKAYYVKASSLTRYIESVNGYNYAYAPFVYVERGDNYLRNYRVYADNAMRPLVKYGSYAFNKAQYIIKNIGGMLASGTTAGYVASKTLYLLAYVQNNGTPIIEHFLISPVYVTLPIRIEPYNPETYGLALAFVSRIISSNKSLAVRYLNSNVVIDFVSSLQNKNNSDILIKIVNSSKIIYIGRRRATTAQFLKYIGEKIYKLNNSIIIRTYRVVPPEVNIQVKNKTKVLIIRLNELYSPYWTCNKCKRIKGMLFNLYIIDNISKKDSFINIRIIHRLWIIKMLSTLLASAAIIYAAIVLFRKV